MNGELFEGIDLDLPDEQLADWIKWALGERDKDFAEDEKRLIFCSQLLRNIR